MKSFKYYQPTRITFGFGKLEEVGEIAKRYGRKCLLVTVSASSVPVLRDLFERTKDILRNEGVEVAHFDGVIPNPTTDSISEGAKMAKEFGTEMVLGLGGGSSMDTAKAIAVEATHQGTAWDYRIFGEK
ncbi:MAG TPA: iron-containing alcohol dehydrogenase, partial [Thermodesulforhabdus norvegica]|nr:iron-containing alcohol dehydrogenase [Thermodesulforhabdus norvegica]